MFHRLITFLFSTRVVQWLCRRFTFITNGWFLIREGDPRFAIAYQLEVEGDPSQRDAGFLSRRKKWPIVVILEVTGASCRIACRDYLGRVMVLDQVFSDGECAGFRVGEHDAIWLALQEDGTEGESTLGVNLRARINPEDTDIPVY